VPAKAEFRRVDNASGGIGFPERAGSAPLRRISPRTARQKCGRRRWLPWCISRSRTSKPRYGSVRLPPFLCFDCEPRPGACHIKENISHSRTRCRLCPLSALGRAIPAFLWTKHRHPKRGPPIRKIKPRLDRGDQRGFLRSASAGAKLFSKLGTYLIVPRYLTASTKNFFAFGLSSVSRHDKLLSLLSSFALSKVPSMPLPAPTIRPTVVSRGPTRTTRISTQVE